MLSLIQNFNTRLAQVERWFLAWAFVLMTAIVFFDVVHREATRPFNTGSFQVRALLFLILIFFAFRRRGSKTSNSAVGAVLLVLGGYGVLKLFVWSFPNGLIWAQTFSLAVMVWVGFVGASLAAYDGRHLGLEGGIKLWPKAWQKRVLAFGFLLTAGFCVFFLLLSIQSVVLHFGDWVGTGYRGGTFPALPVPKWAAFLALPYGFLVLTFRFVGNSWLAAQGRYRGGDEVEVLQQFSSTRNTK